MLLTAGMKLISYAEAPSPVYSAICNPQTQDLTTGGHGEIIVWILRRRRTLQIRQHVFERSQFPLGMAETTISTLICDAVNSKQQTLFAACGLSVLVLNMAGKIVYGNCDIILGATFHAFLGSIPPRARCGVRSTWRRRSLDAGWCL